MTSVAAASPSGSTKLQASPSTTSTLSQPRAATFLRAWRSRGVGMRAAAGAWAARRRGRPAPARVAHRPPGERFPQPGQPDPGQRVAPLPPTWAQSEGQRSTTTILLNAPRSMYRPISSTLCPVPPPRSTHTCAGPAARRGRGGRRDQRRAPAPRGAEGLQRCAAPPPQTLASARPATHQVGTAQVSQAGGAGRQHGAPPVQETGSEGVVCLSEAWCMQWWRGEWTGRGERGRAGKLQLQPAG